MKANQGFFIVQLATPFAYVAHFVFWEMSAFEPKELP
jgi:hypothetical protein